MISYILTLNIVNRRQKTSYDTLNKLGRECVLDLVRLQELAC